MQFTRWDIAFYRQILLIMLKFRISSVLLKILNFESSSLDRQNRGLFFKRLLSVVQLHEFWLIILVSGLKTKTCSQILDHHFFLNFRNRFTRILTIEKRRWKQRRLVSVYAGGFGCCCATVLISIPGCESCTYIIYIWYINYVQCNKPDLLRYLNSLCLYPLLCPGHFKNVFAC